MNAAKFLVTGDMMATMPEPFRQLCVLEPGLLKLWEDARYYADYWSTRPSWRSSGIEASWGKLQIDLAKLVGFRRVDRDDILGSSHAYDCAYRALLDAIGA